MHSVYLRELAKWSTETIQRVRGNSHVQSVEHSNLMLQESLRFMVTQRRTLFTPEAIFCDVLYFVKLPIMHNICTNMISTHPGKRQVKPIEDEAMSLSALDFIIQ